MKISREVLRKAVQEKIISTQQADALLIFLKNQPQLEPGFNLI